METFFAEADNREYLDILVKMEPILEIVPNWAELLSSDPRQKRKKNFTVTGGQAPPWQRKFSGQIGKIKYGVPLIHKHVLTMNFLTLIGLAVALSASMLLARKTRTIWGGTILIVIGLKILLHSL